MNRRDVLSGLKTILSSVSGIKTVVRTYADLVLSASYKTTDLPLIEIREPEEYPETELTGMRQMELLNLTLRVWFIDWAESPTSTYETLVKDIRNKIGGSFTVGDSAVACWVNNVGIVEGEMPLFHFDIALRTKVYLNLQNA